MLRTTFLIFQNEFRLLAKDRIGLFMLILAPVIIISVAGFSLGDIYTRPSDHTYLIPIVDQDHGTVAKLFTGLLDSDPSISVSVVKDLDKAREIVTGRDRAPVAILIPAGTSAAFEAGKRAPLTLYVDPIKRLEVTSIEIRLSQFCQLITAMTMQRSRQTVSLRGDVLRSQFDHLIGKLSLLQSQIERFRDQAAASREAAQRALQARMEQAVRDIETQTQAAVDRSLAETKTSLARELASRRDAMQAVNQYLLKLQASERDFDRWLDRLKTAAGSRSSEIPPPPAWPEPPPKGQLAELSKPLELSIPKPVVPKPPAIEFAIEPFPAMPPLAVSDVLNEVKLVRPADDPTVPGDLGWTENSLTGSKARVNAFDQYVPGFGITFLLVGMLMGLSLGLIDDRDWGTLQRLRVSGASLTGTLIGKLLSRFLIGLVQLIVLFAIGWLLFDISLGRNPLMLLMPAIAISFAAAAFGLIIACVARTHDSVMPVGAVVSMAMSAIGGCWWPLDFEPAWMRAIALWLPTTWTMQAFNDLTIRGLSAGSAMRPSAATAALGLIYLIAGIAGASRLYK